MARPSRWSGPGPSADKLIEILQRASYAAFTELEMEASSRESQMKQGFWFLNASYGKLKDDVSREILALRKQLAESEKSHNPTTNAAMAQNEQLRVRLEQSLLEIEKHGRHAQNERQLRERYQQDYQKAEEKHKIELMGLHRQYAHKLEQQELRLTNEHALTNEKNEEAVRKAERAVCKAEYQVVNNQLMNKHRIELEARERYARADERKICEESRDALMSQLDEVYEKKLSAFQSKHNAELSQKEQEHFSKQNSLANELLRQVEEHKAEASLVQKAYDKLLDSLHTAEMRCRNWEVRFENEVKLNQDNDLKARGEQESLEEQQYDTFPQLDEKQKLGDSLLFQLADSLILRLDSLHSKLVSTISRFKVKEDALLDKVSIQASEINSLQAQRYHLQQELIAKDVSTDQIRSVWETRVKKLEQDLEEKEAEIKTTVRQHNLVMMDANRDEGKQKWAEQVALDMSRENYTERTFPLKPTVHLNVATQAGNLDEARTQIHDLEVRLSECQNRIAILQEEQEVLVEYRLRTRIAETTMAQTRINLPESPNEGTSLVRLPLATEELERNEQVLQQIITQCKTLEEECLRDEAALKVNETELRQLNRRLRALEKEYADEFSYRAAKKRQTKKAANE